MRCSVTVQEPQWLPRPSHNVLSRPGPREPPAACVVLLLLLLLRTADCGLPADHPSAEAKCRLLRRHEHTIILVRLSVGVGSGGGG